METDPAEIARLLGDGSNVFVLHRHADADCVGAASALASAFGGLLWAPAGVASAGQRIAAHCKRAIVEEPPTARRHVLVDVSTWSQIGPGRAVVEGGVFGVVDHHAYGDSFEGAAFLLRDATRASSCEVALTLLDAHGSPPSERVAVGLLAGILADSGRFRWGTEATLEAAARLVRAGAGLEAASRLLEEDPVDERSQRIARLKAARRATLYAVGERIVAASTVSSHESAAAMGLVRLGADVALVATKTSEGARIAARAAAEVPLDLGGILNGLAREHGEAGAAGGGHEHSAGFRASGEPDAWLQATVDRIVRALPGEARELGA